MKAIAEQVIDGDARTRRREPARLTGATSATP